MHVSAYSRAQLAIAELKSAIYELLEASPEGLKNVQIGKALGIYFSGASHPGHISRTLLVQMEAEGVVEKLGKEPRWRLADRSFADGNNGDSD